jgi:hypothetical protein
VNALGYLRVMFTVEDIDDTLARLRKRGAQLVAASCGVRLRRSSAPAPTPKSPPPPIAEWP